MQPSLFEVNPVSGIPVFQQIIEQVQRLIACGQLVEGDLLPSTREVARQLVINPMTVSKAYSTLELLGYLARKKGIGMMIKKPSKARANTVELLRPALKELATQALQLGFTLNETIDLLNESWGDNHG